MLKNNNEMFIREVTNTHFYRNIKTPAVIGVSEEFNFQDKKEVSRKISIILELIKGDTLKEKMDKLSKADIKEPENELLYFIYLIDLAKALEYLHAKQIIHRDIKPPNLMISNDMDLKLIDFGIAKQSFNTSTITKEIGTVVYFPPENVIRNMDMEDEDYLNTCNNDESLLRKISPAYDVWCFGLIASEIFGREVPWGKDVNQNIILINLMSKKKFPIPSSIDNMKLVELIENCTKLNPKERMKMGDILSMLITIFKERLIYFSKKINITDLFRTKKESK